MKVIREALGAPKPVGPYSASVVVANGLVFCAGQLGLNPETGTLVAGGAPEQAVQALRNLTAVLEASGSSLEKAAMITIFLADIADAKAVNEVYSTFVDLTAPPARQTLAVKALPLGALVEISVIAEA
jgi:2-iminobutanoate/2-iminopropanoate deaminase